MREYVETTPSDLQAFSIGRILRESWEICTKYFGALVMPMTILMLCGTPFIFIVEKPYGGLLNNFISGLLGPIAVMGLYRSILSLKAAGKVPTFAATLAEGNDYWWRGFKIAMILGLFTVVALMAGLMVGAIFLIPGFMLTDKNQIVAGVLIVIGVIIVIAVLAWYASRACLCYAAMADGRTSATDAFKAAWSMTKGKIGKTLAIGAIIAGIGLAFLWLVAVFLALMFAVSNEAGLGGVFLALIPSLLLYFFLICYSHVAMGLTYQAFKPAPPEEPLPGA
jgi:hypothetical protein